MSVQTGGGHRYSSENTVLATFSFGGHFVQPSGAILAILVKGHMRNTSVKLF